jgi:hypothetical protein
MVGAMLLVQTSSFDAQFLSSVDLCLRSCLLADYAGPVREMIISNKDVNDQLLFSFLEIAG